MNAIKRWHWWTIPNSSHSKQLCQMRHCCRKSQRLRGSIAERLQLSVQFLETNYARISQLIKFSMTFTALCK